MKPVALLLLLFVAPLLICSEAQKPVDCSAIAEQDGTKPSAVYTIYPSGLRFGVEVFCDMGPQKESWTVIQRRIDGSVNFYRGWDQYVAGFGDAKGEYWLGLDLIHKMTARANQELLVEMEDFEGNQVFARYSSFSVGRECDGYKLTVSGFTDGGAGDSLTFHNGMKFSTYDKDQDLWNYNCAKTHLAGFWFKNCYSANPNGAYLWGAEAKGMCKHFGVLWYQWKGSQYSLKSISFKIRPAK